MVPQSWKLVDRYQDDQVRYRPTLCVHQCSCFILYRLNSSIGLSSGSSVTSLAQRTEASGAIEASSIYKYGSYYYLFTSWDVCCSGTSSTYNIRVGRSTRYYLNLIILRLKVDDVVVASRGRTMTRVESPCLAVEEPWSWRAMTQCVVTDLCRRAFVE